MVLPNFLIIGAAKAGTTSIAQYLDQHPQIYISPIKEPFFFSFEGEDLSFCGPGDSQSLRLCVNNLQDYEELFKGVSDEIAIGEASTSYLYTPKAAERIYHYIPHAKLVAILRNPVDAAYSSFLHQTREGYEPSKSFLDALEDEERRIKENWMYFWHYKNNGFYYEKIKRYYELFPKEQIRVLIYDNFIDDSLAFIETLFEFLEVDNSFRPDIGIKYNVSGIPRNRLLHYLTTESRPVKKALRFLIPRPLRSKFRNLNLDKPKLPHEIRKVLLNDYRQDIYQLEDLIQKDLSGWLPD